MVTRIGSNHYKWEHEKATLYVVSSSTPSCPYAIKKIKHDLKKALRQ